ncbi:MAG: family 16 glycoside hydrolase, partial [Planctomycetota bacterium]
FTGVGYGGGLPGDGWDGESPERVKNVELKDGSVKFEGSEGVAFIRNGKCEIEDFDGNSYGTLERVDRVSKTMGMKPPKEAIVLFDGKSVENWEHRGKPARMTDDGLLMQGAASKQKFQDHRIHVEFLLPYKPKARGQGRGNSGLYLQGRYEVQMLDSFGLSGEQNECGGVYSISKPDQNMCYPPLRWQTYDVEFHAAKFEDGKKTKNAWMTVQHNGVTIHDKLELTHSTTASPLKEGPESGYVYLQDHGNPVRYRNIWVEPLGDSASAATTQTAKKLAVKHPVDMEYLLYLPEDYDADGDKTWPLMLFLHGAGERGDDINKVAVHGPPKLIKKGKQFPFIVVSPQCKKDRWWEPIGLTALLDEIESKYRIDKSRVYVTGLSMGGFGTWMLASYTPERFAAIAPICGGGDRTMTPYMIGNRIPTWVFHGGKDFVVPLSRSQELVDAFKKRKVDIKFTVYPDAGHDSWTKTYDNEELYEWMLSHSKK